ncbi:hypothetical protein LIER_19896 [Lithospermum erythrorhizon]|uniref:RNase H type-1 domain-containing protein n=1 Tax=Lithospermum erythrorhizon TaxID=34254 RepID=A0AAV3QKY9_LITER
MGAQYQAFDMVFAQEHGWNCVEIESGSKSLIQVLKGEAGLPVEVDVIIWDVLWSRAKLQFIRRNGNNAAHLMVHWNCGSEKKVTWLDTSPH